MFGDHVMSLTVEMLHTNTHCVDLHECIYFMPSFIVHPYLLNCTFNFFCERRLLWLVHVQGVHEVLGETLFRHLLVRHKNSVLFAT